ncbi:MAG: pyridoxal-phosphate dependent enzyme [Myxococcota bacterium]
MLHHVTPLLPSTPLSDLLGRPVWLKMESSQPCGSFKLRGIGRACEAAVASGARRVVASSGGNAGYAVAWSARRLGIPSTVVVPSRTSHRMRSLIAAEGAEIVVHGEVWDDAHARAQVLADETGGVLIHPFDDPEVWAGHATLVHEVAAAIPEPGFVVVAVGGGGLLAGVVHGLAEVGWSSPVLAVETHGAASYARALEAGHPVDLDAIDSIALTLGAKRVCDESVAVSRGHRITSWTCDDRAAVEACARFLDDHRVLVEPSCGAALAAVYDGAPALSEAASVVVVVCGGAAVTRGALDQWSASLA